MKKVTALFCLLSIFLTASSAFAEESSAQILSVLRSGGSYVHCVQTNSIEDTAVHMNAYVQVYSAQLKQPIKVDAISVAPASVRVNGSTFCISISSK